MGEGLSIAEMKTMLSHPAVDVEEARSAGETSLHCMAATAGVKWSEFGQFENVARRACPKPSGGVNQRDIEEDARIATTAVC